MSSRQGPFKRRKTAIEAQTPPSPECLAYAAGFIDGEACIHIARQRYGNGRSDTFRLGVHIAQNDLPALKSFRDAVGINAPIYEVKRARNHRKQCYTLNFHGHGAVQLLQAVLPYLRRKFTEAQAALAFWGEGRVSERGKDGRLTPAVVATRERYYQLLKQLK